MATEDKECELRPGGMLVQRREFEDHHHAHQGHRHGSSASIRISISRGSTNHEILVPQNSTFGDVKKVIEQETGLPVEQQKLLFRGVDKENGESLRESGVKDKSKVLLLENLSGVEKTHDRVPEGSTGSGMEEFSETMSKALLAVAEVREEVNKLEERVAAIQVTVNSGTKVSNEEFSVSSELLMRQLLKLDAIEAEGEARMQRKAEVRRVQSFHEMLDMLKTRNSNPFSHCSNSVSVTTEWETFDSGLGSLTPPPPLSSTLRNADDWERFD